MVKAYFKAFLFSLISLVPIIAMVLIFWGVGIVIFTDQQLINFLVGFAFMVVGIPTFTYFAEITIHDIGGQIGQSLSKQKHMFILIFLAILLGFIFTLAEPDLAFLAEQTPLDNYLFILVVAVGVGLMFVLGILRILFDIDLRIVLLITYTIAFMLVMLIPADLQACAIPIIFDAGGSVTGSVSVPLIIAIGVGITSNLKNKKADATFGLSGIVSVGPIIVMALTFIIAKTSGSVNVGITHDISHYILEALKNAAIALSPIVVFYTIYAKFVLKIKFIKILKTVSGFAFIYAGLLLFLSGANTGFLSIGPTIGAGFAANSLGQGLIFLFMIIVGFIIAFAEPSIKILARQIEEISEGSIKAIKLLIVFGCGISLALVITFVRILYQIDIIYFIVPVYAVIFVLMFFVDKKYVGIAFDAGAVCSGTIATAFCLPVAIGFSSTINSGQDKMILSTSFGVLAMIAAIPILMVEIVGIQAKFKQKLAYAKARKRVKDDNENQIIHFE
jgi:hypothetical protein